MTGALTKIAICGAGAMGSGIAQVAAQAGAEVIVFDVQDQALAAGEKRIAASIDTLVARGKLTSPEAVALRARMTWTSDLARLADAELVVEAIVEDAVIKGRLFEQLEAIVAPDAIIASNTSSLPISRLARTLKKPERFVGMHFFNPATAMKLVEVIAGAATDPKVADAVWRTAQAWGKVAILVADVPGFIVNRVARPFYAEAFSAIGEGVAEPAVIDALFRSAGFRMGPLELTDLIGQDVNLAVARSVYDSYFGRVRFVPQLRQAALVDAGWLGRKTGRGVYRYDDGGPSAVVPESAGAAVLAEHRRVARLWSEGGAEAFVDCQGVKIGRTRGISARAESVALGKPVALLDWFALDGGEDVGFAATSDDADAAARGFLAALGKTGHRLADRPGLIVSRTLAQLANAAADAVLERVADETGVDAALRFGANYPFGSFAWADAFGRRRLVSLLDAMAGETGEAIYRPSFYLRNFA
ncbi:3-hydroxyacyl-CoA dehydrogenase NAD-binding domain-containing protein [Sphingobium sp.]|uniref:3-hydroxyacyl-CoA dehydrogenase NAD-binding domain-containing protein n=1 Tax=Sphingobium sp. TaxID=1912891 RepID=UPI0028BECA72|nr:3-hydroxyacyl-CoA dehydrogenase NAD-binding domain-containing protein [Sphingobium sp.]